MMSQSQNGEDCKEGKTGSSAKRRTKDVKHIPSSRITRSGATRSHIP